MTTLISPQPVILAVGSREARVEVLTFASRDHPTLVCQAVAIEIDGPCDMAMGSKVEPSGIGGRALRVFRDTPGEGEPGCDGMLLGESTGGYSTCGLGHHTQLLGEDATPERPPLDGAGWKAIEIDRLWIRGRPWRLSARNSAGKADLTPA